MRKLDNLLVIFFMLCLLISSAANGQRYRNGRHLRDSIEQKKFEEHVNELDSVTVKNRKPIQTIRESPFNVVALDARAAYNSTMQLSDLLNQASGVKVRQSGGLGSAMSISLNGFTGRNVKLFMDGVPMDGFGSAFQLNNIPVNVADRIEVYKGVVPIEFGTDAMGGVINIVTNQSANTFVDASYSYGSFNTQKANLSFGHTTRSGFTIQGNAFINHSDNDYKIMAPVLDLQGLNFSDPQLVRRFHDQYQNKTLMLKAGFVKKWWADRFLLGLTVGDEKADVQMGYNIKFVFGQRRRTGSSLIPSLQYEKNNLFVKGLRFKLTANYNKNNNRNIDTSSMRYNWLGQRVQDEISGESGTNTLSKFTNTNASSTANLSYNINHKSSITINDVISGYKRKTDSDVPLSDIDSPADTMRRSSYKNVVGLSYRYRHNEHWNFNAFLKNYYQSATGPYDTSARGNGSYISRTNSYSVNGYGIAATYVLKEFQLKASWERAYRLPTETELFGDEVNVTSNTSLTAENSMNYNLGVTMNKSIAGGSILYVDVNAYYRNTKNYIRQVVSLSAANPGTIGSVNFGKTLSKGIDLEAHYYYKNVFTIGTTASYLDLINNETNQGPFGTAKDPHYGERMPNIPYFYGNTDATYYVHDLFGKGNVLNLSYTFNYVGMFYYDWESNGSPAYKVTIPKQLYHDLMVSYTMKRGRYNVAFEALNITNQDLFDNYGLQKAGRSFSIKLRYYFSKKG